MASITKQDLTDALSATKKDLTDNLDATKQDLTDALSATKKDLLTSTRKDLADALTATKKDLTDALQATKQDLTEVIKDTEHRIIDSVTTQFNDITDIMATSEELDEVKKEVFRQGVLYEVIDGKLDTALENTATGLKLVETGKDHESRITKLEDDNKIIKKTVKHHSEHLNTL